MRSANPWTKQIMKTKNNKTNKSRIIKLNENSVGILSNKMFYQVIFTKVNAYCNTVCTKTIRFYQN